MKGIKLAAMWETIQEDEMVRRIKVQPEEQKATKCANCERLDTFHTLSLLSLTIHTVW